jgi:hypothetical protein
MQTLTAGKDRHTFMRDANSNGSSLSIALLCFSGIAAVIVAQWVFQWMLVIWPL